MQVKIINGSNYQKVENEANLFLRTIQPGAIKYIKQSSASWGSSEDVDTEVTISIWYEQESKHAPEAT